MYPSGRIDIESSPQLRGQLLALPGKQLPPGTITVDDSFDICDIFPESSTLALRIRALF